MAKGKLSDFKLTCESCMLETYCVQYRTTDGTQWVHPPEGWLSFLRNDALIYVCGLACADRYITTVSS